MAHVAQRFCNDRQFRGDRGRALQGPLSRHRPDDEGAGFLFDEVEFGHAVEIHDAVRKHVAHIEHRHQRLPAGEQPGVLACGQQCDGFRQLRRRKIFERRRVSMIGPYWVS